MESRGSSGPNEPLVALSFHIILGKVNITSTLQRVCNIFLIHYELILILFLSCPSVRHTVCQRNSSETTEQNFMKLGR